MKSYGVRLAAISAGFILSLGLSLGAAAKDVYKFVDAEGNVEYSDQPRDGAKKINVAPVTTIVMPKASDLAPPDPIESTPLEDESGVNPYVKLRIVKPADDEAFHSGSGNVEFTVSSEPVVSGGHQYQILIDGKVAATSSGTTFTVENVDRGEHSASIQVVDQTGKVIQSGGGIMFTVHRPIVRPQVAPRAN